MSDKSLRLHNIFDPLPNSTDLSCFHFPLSFTLSEGHDTAPVDRAGIQMPYVDMFIISQHLILGQALVCLLQVKQWLWDIAIMLQWMSKCHYSALAADNSLP